MAGMAPTVPQASVPSAPGQQRVRGRTPLKLLSAGVLLIALGATIGFSISRELASPGDSARSTAPAPSAPRPALAPEEQGYVDALWPIHTGLEVASERVALGAILYKTNDVDRADLKSRLEQSLSTYQVADSRLRGLRPPPSLQSWHQSYLTAVRLFSQSAVEMLKLFDDNDDNHLQAGYPMFLEGTNKIRDIGGKFWPDEFPPN